MTLFKQRLRIITLNIGNTDPEDILGPCPPPGQRNGSLMGAAGKLKTALYDRDEAYDALQTWLTRDPQNGEIERVINKVYAEDDDGTIFIRKKEEEEFIPEPLDTDRIFDAYQEFGGVRDLVSLSSNELSIDPDGANIEQPTTRAWLWQLYKPGDLLCVGYRMSDTKVKPLEEWTDRFLYYSALLSPCTYQVEWNTRRKIYVNRVPYFVLEFDYDFNEPEFFELACRYDIQHDPEACKYFGLDLQAGVILSLMQAGLPVVSVVYSGNKSLHCWCAVDGWDWEDLTGDKLYGQLCAVGVDPHGRTACQLMRIANPYNPKRQQPLFYHNTQYLNK